VEGYPEEDCVGEELQAVGYGRLLIFFSGGNEALPLGLGRAGRTI